MMAGLSADERKTLTNRRWELERMLDDWNYKLIRPPAYDDVVAERDNINLALQGGEAGQAIGDTIRPEVGRLARNIAAAVERLGDELVAADAFSSQYKNLDQQGETLLETLRFPASADPREATSTTRKWIERAVHQGLIRR